jgi:hypothetical protein
MTKKKRDTINTKKNVYPSSLSNLSNIKSIKNAIPIFNQPINTHFVLNVSYMSSKWVKITTNQYEK